MPHVNFERMTALTVGRPWRQATPAQKEAIMKEFRTLLIRTYANAFATVKDQKIQMRPFRGEADQKDVVVRSQVVQPGGDPIQLDYRLEKHGDDWRIYDVNVLGVWLVQTYRNQFGQEISAGDGPMMADVGDGTTAITLPERVDNSNVQAVLKSLEAECKARRLTKESRVLVDLVRLKEFDSTVLSALLEMGRYAGKPLAVHNPPRKLVSLAELYGVADFLLDDHPELRRMRQEREAQEK